MKKNSVDVSKLRLAQVRYFDAERKGSLIPDESAYVFLIEVNGTFVNVFNPLEEFPVFGRAPYSNTTSDGIEFGTKIVLVQGELQDGPCYIMDKRYAKDIFGKDEVTKEEIEDYIINSDRFFVDRINILEHRRDNLDFKRRKQIKSDRAKLAAFNEYIESQEKGYTYKIM